MEVYALVFSRAIFRQLKIAFTFRKSTSAFHSCGAWSPAVVGTCSAVQSGRNRLQTDLVTVAAVLVCESTNAETENPCSCF